MLFVIIVARPGRPGAAGKPKGPVGKFSRRKKSLLQRTVRNIDLECLSKVLKKRHEGRETYQLTNVGSVRG